MGPDPPITRFLKVFSFDNGMVTDRQIRPAVDREFVVDFIQHVFNGLVLYFHPARDRIRIDSLHDVPHQLLFARG